MLLKQGYNVGTLLAFSAAKCTFQLLLWCNESQRQSVSCCVSTDIWLCQGSICKEVRSEWLQVLLRFQWVMEVMRGQSTHMEMSLEGLATSVMGGLQDELFNLTLDNIQVSAYILYIET